ncbi:MAG TPA: acetylglutamate kinase [Gemmatimonadaceae bacterium]|nr:acetylglutamate kinase [Gemmatimonadaceae bacterium]
MTRVIKIGGRPQGDPSLASILASGWAKARTNGGLVLVHGGGDEVSTLQSALGGSTAFVNGRRVTTEQDIAIVRMALSGSANKRLVSSLIAAGVDAVGVSGEDAALIAASPMDAANLGYVGTPTRVNVAFLRHLMAGGYLPVVSPVSRDGSGTMGSALNVNGDDAAAAMAVALGAEDLLLVADVPGVMREGAVIPRLTPDEAHALIADGTAAGGMQAKLQAALAALAGGVAQVRISDIAAIADPTRGTILRSVGEHS